MEKTNNQTAANIQALSKMIHEVDICMFTTTDDKGSIASRPMGTVHIDDEANIWFFTNEYSEKIQEVSKDNSVNLIYAHPGKNIYLNIKGSCKIIIDKSKMKEFWNPLMKAWFPGGLDDPKLCLLKVMTEEAYYWNSSSNKMIVFANMLKAIAKGEKYEDGVMGKMKL
ncbi:pyridoxamine 5'-phosphate oxidase family protein [Flavihumibacter fluvii]|uniref:pyridoxamine 5'-phosphate oxidase family protein n=1 Tax=Flavihumibacter fluvii TaxID=2838157 RepID=UPI001BDE8806|nr:pyridoxamine 5'-phosphate oxidase family protein [Flavihumibacter fluvii]ULQ51880.1 pyridoxamine 5'-phosphate oxidase family protein [Flavihumibacter fluvii]